MIYPNVIATFFRAGVPVQGQERTAGWGELVATDVPVQMTYTAVQWLAVRQMGELLGAQWTAYIAPGTDVRTGDVMRVDRICYADFTGVNPGQYYGVRDVQYSRGIVRIFLQETQWRAV